HKAKAGEPHSDCRHASLGRTQFMRFHAVVGMTVAVFLVGCASNKPAQTPAPQAAAPEPVKAQEASPQQRAQIKTDLAAGYYERALGASPGNATAAYNLALLAYREARLDDARSWMRPVMRDNAPRPEALYLGMCIERKQGDRQAEISYMTQLRNRYPDSAEAKALAAKTCD